MDVLERAGLLAVAVDSHVFTFEGLNDKVGDDAAIIRLEIMIRGGLGRVLEVQTFIRGPEQVLD